MHRNAYYYDYTVMLTEELKTAVLAARSFSMLSVPGDDDAIMKAKRVQFGRSVTCNDDEQEFR